MDNELTPVEVVIYCLLKQQDALFMHVTPDGNSIYFLFGEGENEGLMKIERLEGKSFSLMSGDELNEVLSDFLENLFS
jgi:hypothetical protein